MDRKYYLRKYRRLHQEEIKEYQREYRKDNLKIKWQIAEWRKRHPKYFVKNGVFYILITLKDT